MGRVILCTGKEAGRPFFFEDGGIQVYSIEELCFCLKENAYILDGSIVSRKLVSWIGEECGLEELAGQLLPLVSEKGTLSAFVDAILRYVHLYDEAALTQIDTLLKKSANLSSYEKYKTRIDYMVEKGRYGSALIEYDDLLSRLPEEEWELTARVWHNKGVALAGLFLFPMAADCFAEAYRLMPKEEIYVEFLAAKRMYMSDVDYISFAAEDSDKYELTLELERRVEAYKEQWESHIDRKRLDQMQEWRNEGETMKYYGEAERITQGLKTGYRMNVGE